MLTSCRQYKPCRIRHGHPIIITRARYPLNSILPCVAPEDLTLTRSAAGVSYFVGATVKHLIKGLQSEAEQDTIDKFEHGLLSLSLAQLCPHTPQH